MSHWLPFTHLHTPMGAEIEENYEQYRLRPQN